MIIVFIMALAVPTFISVNVALWLFGVRPYIHRHGRACITAANWGFSIWADLSTAWEIGKKEGRLPLSVTWLFALQVIEAVFVVLVVIGSAMQ